MSSDISIPTNSMPTHTGHTASMPEPRILAGKGVLPLNLLEMSLSNGGLHKLGE